jgi:hypothetical protein
MRALAFLLPLLLLSTPVRAGDKPEKPAVHYVALSPVAMPVIVDGRVRNYIFVYIRLDLTPSADAQVWQDREPYFRDALVRAGHRTPFVLAHDWTHLDEAALKRAMMAEAGRIAGPGVVVGVEITKSIPQRYVAAPRA